MGVILEAIETEQAFPRVAEDDKKRVCRFCNYRSLCWENVAAGAFVEMFEEDEPVEIDDEDVFGFDVDLDQIAEIEF